MARQNIETMLEKRVNKLRDEEKSKKEELAQIQKELRRNEAALESLNGNFPPLSRKRKAREEAKNGNPD
jgi:peptidoglycan hydrolase CwlO-like protein